MTDRGFHPGIGAVTDRGFTRRSAPGESAEASETDVARRIAFTLARATQAEPAKKDNTADGIAEPESKDPGQSGRGPARCV